MTGSTASPLSLQSKVPLRILHYVPAVRLEQGGVVRAILDWCTVLAERGHRMTLVTYNGKDLPADWLVETPGKPRGYVVPFPMPPAKLLSRSSMKLIDGLLSETDVLHLHAPWLDGNRQIANLAHRRGVPYVVTLHGMLDDWAMSNSGWKKRVYMSLFGRRTLNRAALVHCTAYAELAQTRKWFDHPNAVVLPCLMDLQPYQNLESPDAGLQLVPTQFRTVPKLLFLSRLSEQKGVPTLLRAAALLRDAGTPFVLLLAGTGFPEYERLIHRLVAELNLTEQVVFLGHIDGTTKLSLYRAADLFVLPTRHENFGLVLTEAMASGTCVVTTRGTDIWPEVQSAGGEIAESTPRAIADAVTRLLGDPAERRRRGDSCRRWVMENLDEDRLSGRYEQMYRGIVASTPA